MTWPFKGVMIDLDNTLYDYEPCHNEAVDRVLDDLSRKVNRDVVSLRQNYDLARRETHDRLRGLASSHNRLLYFQRMFELIDVNPVDGAIDCYHQYWNVFIDHIKIFDGVMEFLESLKKKGIRICFVTDLTADIQHQKLKRLDLTPYVDHLVTSEEAGCEKPHPEIFQYALKKINLRPEDVCMIGDDYEKDIQGATQLGIQAFWMNRGGKTEEKSELITEFQSFKELLPTSNSKLCKS